MRIGIDIDDTTTNSTKTVREYIEKYGNNYCDDNYMTKNIDIILRGFFENDGVKKFFRDNAVRMATEIEVKKDAPNIINRLHEEGHEIYFITARSDNSYGNAKDFCEKYLKKHNIYFDKVITSQLYKVNACKENHIDLMIDDGVDTCDSINNEGLKALLFNSELNIDKEATSPRVNDWNEVYDFIKNM